MTEEDILEIISEWKHFWMNQTQNSQQDYENYYRRAFGIDANMQHHLATLLLKQLPNIPSQDKSGGGI